MEGLGPIRPSARGNTIPREERGAEVKFVIQYLSILFCYRLSYTQPFRNSVVDGDGVYTGEDTLVKKWKETSSFFSGDDQGGFEWRRMGSKNCIRQFPNQF